MAEKIIDPVSPELIKAELTEDKKLRNTNHGGNEIYVVTYQDAPNVLREIGRLREIAFRSEGGGSGLSMDLDEFDTMEHPYKQIVVWDPDANAILGGYRYIFGGDTTFQPNGQPNLATAHMFHFSDEFIKDYLPHVMELGRSFVSVDYQSSKAGAKAMFALDNLWDGIATVTVQHPQIMYFFGKMTMYPSYDRIARDLILHFLGKHFPDPDELIRPFKPVIPETSSRLMDIILRDDDFKADYRNLKDAVRRLKTNIPPLVNSYMNTSPTMKVFGTAINDTFSDVEETAIMVCFDEMYAEKIDRHVKSYFSDRMIKFRERFPRLAKDIEERLLARTFERRKKVSGRFWARKKK